MSKKENIAALVETWRVLIPGEEASWVLFEHGTCVMLKASVEDLQGQAKEVLAKWGPVVPGTELGDFEVIKLQDYPGWVITYAFPLVINYVSPDEVENDESSDPIKRDVVIGCIGREKRQEDAKSLNIVHVEDKSS